ncbi:hypothetical protein AB0L97_38395, partial [Nocardia sp. NPDC051911]
RADRTAVRTRERYAQVHTLLAQGHSLRRIGRQLGLARGTIRRFARAASPDELLVNNRTGYRDQSLLDEFKPYLHQRWNQGTTDAARLFAEIKIRGYRGQANLVSITRPPDHEIWARTTIRPTLTFILDKDGRSGRVWGEVGV